MIKVVDNFIPLKKQEEYKKLLIEDNFPWFYTPDVGSANGEAQKRPAMSHGLYHGGVMESTFLDVEVLGRVGARVAGVKFNNILNAKTILQLPLNPTFMGTDLDYLHVDTIDPFVKHMVVLYYVVDADGDTIICDKRVDGATQNGLKAEDYPILNRVTPKQGRAVIFDGEYYHTAEQPKDGIRCIINLNIV